MYFLNENGLNVKLSGKDMISCKCQGLFEPHHEKTCLSAPIDSKIHLLPKSEISSLWPSYVTVKPGLCRTWWETPKTGFLTTRQISFAVIINYAIND